MGPYQGSRRRVVGPSSDVSQVVATPPDVRGPLATSYLFIAEAVLKPDRFRVPSRPSGTRAVNGHILEMLNNVERVRQVTLGVVAVRFLGYCRNCFLVAAFRRTRYFVGHRNSRASPGTRISLIKSTAKQRATCSGESLHRGEIRAYDSSWLAILSSGGHFGLCGDRAGANRIGKPC